MPLSPNKTRFLQRNATDEIFLTLEQVTELARYLNTKHGITIYVKGDLQAHHIEINPALLAAKHISFEHKTKEEVGSDEEGEESDDEYDNDLYQDFDATEEALIDILSIQATLTLGQTVGYIYSRVMGGEGHFECFVIRQHEIIKPQLWYVYELALRNNNVMAEKVCLSPWVDFSVPDFTAFQHISTITSTIAQADESSCASLCLATLKNLLKNGAQQLNDLTLQVPWLNQKNQIEYFFLASPQILKYTQISAYNESMKALLLPEVEGEEIYLIKHLKTLIQTLESLSEPSDLPTSYQIAKQRAEALISLIPNFAERWLSSYEMSMAKRALMKKHYNEYLAYTAHRYWLKSNFLYYDKRFQISAFIEQLQRLNVSVSSLEPIFSFIVNYIGEGDTRKVNYVLAKIGTEAPYLTALTAIAFYKRRSFYRYRKSSEYKAQQEVKNDFNKFTSMCDDAQRSSIIENIKLILPLMVNDFFDDEKISDLWFIICGLKAEEIKTYLERNSLFSTYLGNQNSKSNLSDWLLTLTHYCYLTEKSELPEKFYEPLYIRLNNNPIEKNIEIFNQLLKAFTIPSLLNFFNAYPQLNSYLLNTSVDLYFRKERYRQYNKKELIMLWQGLNLFTKCLNEENIQSLQLKLVILLNPFVDYNLRKNFLSCILDMLQPGQRKPFFASVFPDPVHQAGLKLTYLEPRKRDIATSYEEENIAEPPGKRVTCPSV